MEEEEELLGTFESPTAASSQYSQKNHQEEGQSSISQWEEKMGMGGGVGCGVGCGVKGFGEGGC